MVQKRTSILVGIFCILTLVVIGIVIQAVIRGDYPHAPPPYSSPPHAPPPYSPPPHSPPPYSPPPHAPPHSPPPPKSMVWKVLSVTGAYDQELCSQTKPCFGTTAKCVTPFYGGHDVCVDKDQTPSVWGIAGATYVGTCDGKYDSAAQFADDFSKKKLSLVPYAFTSQTADKSCTATFGTNPFPK